MIKAILWKNRVPLGRYGKYCELRASLDIMYELTICVMTNIPSIATVIKANTAQSQSVPWVETCIGALGGLVSRELISLKNVYVCDGERCESYER